MDLEDAVNAESAKQEAKASGFLEKISEGLQDSHVSAMSVMGAALGVLLAYATGGAALPLAYYAAYAGAGAASSYALGSYLAHDH